MNLLLFDTFNLWYITLFVVSMWSGVARILSIHLASLGLCNLVNDMANIKGSSSSKWSAFMALYRKLYWRCFTTAGNGSIPSSIKHKSLAELLRTPNKYFIAQIYNFSTSWQLPPIQLSHTSDHFSVYLLKYSFIFSSTLVLTYSIDVVFLLSTMSIVFRGEKSQ